MKPLRIGVVGVGHLGQHHARILSAMPGVRLVGVADASPERAAAVAARCQTTALADYRRLLPAVDAAVIAVPTVLHREVAGAFLQRGIATLVEKPMAGTLAEAEQLAALADATGAVLQVGHIERFNPALQALDRLPVRPRYINAERLSTFTFRSTDIGVVLDLMIHDLDLILSLIAAPVRSVAAVGVSVFGEHEDVANARIEFEDGSVANVTASRASDQAVRKMRIWGVEGYASLDFAAHRPSWSARRIHSAAAGWNSRAWTSASPPRSRTTSSARCCAWTGSPARAPSRWRWSSRTSSPRRGAAPARGSAARRASAPCGWPTRSSAAWSRTDGTAPGRRPPHRCCPSRVPSSRARMPGASRA